MNLLNVLFLFDYSKAFDLINHTLAVIHYLGFFVQMVKLPICNTYSGVPQGSILPLSYLFSTSQLKTCQVHSYADDIQKYQLLKTRFKLLKGI